MTFTGTTHSRPIALTRDSKFFRPSRLIIGAVFPVVDRVPSQLLPEHLHYSGYPYLFISRREGGQHVKPFVRWMGEKRPPRKDEFYISGSDPSGYLAINDIDTPYCIGKLCFAEERTTTMYTCVYE